MYLKFRILVLPQSSVKIYHDRQKNCQNLLRY